jgi:hypothetical protein
MANTTGKKSQFRRPLSSRPMDLVYFIFFLVRVRSRLHRPINYPSIYRPISPLTINYTSSPPSSAATTSAKSYPFLPSIHGISLIFVPFVPISKNTKLEKNRSIYHPRCWWTAKRYGRKICFRSSCKTSPFGTWACRGIRSLVVPWVSSETVPTLPGSSHSCISKRKLRSNHQCTLPVPLSSPLRFCPDPDQTCISEPCSFFQLPVFFIGAYGLWRGE